MGRPQILRSDNSPEFIAAALRRWANEHDTVKVFITPHQHWRGSFIKSLHNRMRDELLAGLMFEDLDRALISARCQRFNEEHPTARWAGSHPTNT